MASRDVAVLCTMNPMSESDAPTLFHLAWSLPKGGNTAQQNDDAWHVESIPGDPGPDGLLVALADGATEAVYSGQWACHLVQSARADWPLLGDAELNERLGTVRASFSPIVAEEKSLPWFVRDKLLTQGSQTALLLASILAAEEGACFAIKALSVGDCCLLLLRASGELRAFPIETAADFGVHPALVGTRLNPPLTYARWEDELHYGDVLLACTDAVAKWVMQCWEAHLTDALYGWLIRLLSPVDAGAGSTQTGTDTTHCPSDLEPASQVACPNADFSEFIQENRAAKDALRMRNDDSTLIICVPMRRAAADSHVEALHVLERQLGLQAANLEN
jgi:hypothetical protein